MGRRYKNLRSKSPVWGRSFECIYRMDQGIRLAAHPRMRQVMSQSDFRLLKPLRQEPKNSISACVIIMTRTVMMIIR